MHRERSLNMQQAVLGCYQLDDAFQLLPAASPGVTPQILTEHEEEQVLKASTSSQTGGGRGKAESRESRFVPADSPLPKQLSLTLPWHTRSRVGYITAQIRRSICQQAWPGMRGPGTHSLPWLLKDIQSRSRFLEQWISHGGAGMPHLLCS